MRACPWRKWNALAFKKLSRAFAIHKLMSAGGLFGIFAGASCTACGRRCRLARFVRGTLQRRWANVHARANEPRRNAIFLCDEIITLLGNWNDRNRVGLDFYFETGLRRDVAQRFAERNLIEGDRDARFGRRNGRSRNKCGRDNRFRGNRSCNRAGWRGFRWNSRGGTRLIRRGRLNWNRQRRSLVGWCSSR